MARLVVMHDPLRGLREHHILNDGATLADELRRLYPEGFGARWMLHKAHALADGEIDASLHEQIKVETDATYIVTVKPSGPVIPFVAKLIFTLAISFFLGKFTEGRTPSQIFGRSEEEEKQSPNNQLAAQSNRLRAGARVPDILGRVRSYPDLLSAPVERWFWPHTQSISQFFVIGRGSYEMLSRRLGDTSLQSIDGTSWNDYPPGTTITTLQALRHAPTVDSISLTAQDSATVVTGVTFDAETKTVSSPTRIGLEIENPYFITGTFNNTGDFWVTAVPTEEQTVGPYIYTLDGIVVDETANAVFNLDEWRDVVLPGSWITNPRGVTNEIWMNSHLVVQVGDLAHAASSALMGDPFLYMGRVVSYEYADPYDGETYIRVANMDGTLPVFALGYFGGYGSITTSIPGGGSTVRAPDYVPTPYVDAPTYTNWFVAPIEQPDEIWVDFEFPQGLSHYASGVRNPFTVSINVEFRAVATPATVVTKTYTYTSSSTTPLRSTEITTLTELGMVGPIEVRMLRTTAIMIDSATDQYIQDTRWKSFRAVKNIPAHSYPDVTATQLIIFNSLSASSVGESSFNLIATRILPTWTGSAWSAPAPTEKWADNLIARMKAIDGAHKSDAEIDIAGIYALQAALDAQDSGNAGKISMTLDALQDIDAELQTIAAVMRAQVYRVGRKLFVTRDEGGKIPLALFTSRSKAPDGEQVQLAMKNDTENDAVVVSWFDRDNGWKQREFVYAEPPNPAPVNPLRVMPVQATWAQAYRRALYEWKRSQYRRDALSMDVTEEARLIHIGDVINVADDIANLAQSAGEVYAVAGLTLTLDREISLAAGGFTIMLRSQDGRAVDSMTVTQGATLRHVVLARAAAFAIKGRDEGMGTIFAIYQSASAVIRPWLVTGIEPGLEYTHVVGVNWRNEVFAGDSGTLPPVPEFAIARGLPHDNGA
jgi:hypothetical protein